MHVLAILYTMGVEEGGGSSHSTHKDKEGGSQSIKGVGSRHSMGRSLLLRMQGGSYPRCKVMVLQAN